MSTLRRGGKSRAVQFPEDQDLEAIVIEGEMSASHERGPSTVFAALWVKDYALLWSGQSISSLGDGVFTIALVLVALHLGHSSIDLADVLAARAVPSVVFALLGGVVVDRIPRRVAMLTSDSVRGLAVGVVAILLARHQLQLWQLIVMSAVFGTADAFFGPASMAIVPELLDDHLLVQGNALGQMSGQLSQGLIGPAAGGIIVSSIGYAWSFGVDAISFVVSALCLLAMKIRTPRVLHHGTAMAEALEGIAYVRSQKWLVASLLGAALANFFGMTPLTVLLPLMVRHVLSGSALSLGLVFAAGGAAGVTASLVVARMGSPRLRVTVLWTAYAAGGAAIAVMAVSPNVWIVGLCSAAEVGLLIYGDVLWVAMMQELVPREVLGRVSSLVYLLAFSLGPLGILFGGVVASAVGTRATLAISGLTSGLICVIVLFAPGVRDPERAPV
jgi:DHA3 family tetracycline resistance protein-like MFS transporter